MHIINDKEKPVIKIYFTKGMNTDRILKTVTEGIEEEGIPFFIRESRDDALSNSYIASRDSRLGTGIGITDREVVVHNERLERDKPLFRKNACEGGRGLRELGSNAARLVKRTPFK